MQAPNVLLNWNTSRFSCLVAFCTLGGHPAWQQNALKRAVTNLWPAHALDAWMHDRLIRSAVGIPNGGWRVESRAGKAHWADGAISRPLAGDAVYSSAARVQRRAPARSDLPGHAHARSTRLAAGPACALGRRSTAGAEAALPRVLQGDVRGSRCRQNDRAARRRSVRRYLRSHDRPRSRGARTDRQAGNRRDLSAATPANRRARRRLLHRRRIRHRAAADASPRVQVPRARPLVRAAGIPYKA